MTFKLPSLSWIKRWYAAHTRIARAKPTLRHLGMARSLCLRKLSADTAGGMTAMASFYESDMRCRKLNPTPSSKAVASVLLFLGVTEC